MNAKTTRPSYDESHIGNVVYNTEYQCPNCGSYETDYDGYCVHCGESVVVYDEPVEETPVSRKNLNKGNAGRRQGAGLDKRKLIIAAGIAVAALLMIIILVSVVGKSGNVKLTFTPEQAQALDITGADLKNNENISKVTENSDGSITVEIPKKQHKEMMAEMQKEIDKSLKELTDNEMISFTNIKANSDYTKFTVTCSGDSLGLFDTISTLSFYYISGTYNFFNGTEVDNVHIDFVDSNGNIIESTDSGDLIKALNEAG